MGFFRHDPKGLIYQSDLQTALNLGKQGGYFIINVARDAYNPYAKFHIKYDDLVPINPEDLYRVAVITRTNFENNIKTLIHCVAGVHRSVTFALASIMLTYNVKAEDAMRMLCEPCIDFNTYIHEIPFHYLSLKLFEQYYIAR